MFFNLSNSLLPNISHPRSKIVFVAFPERRSCALSVSMSNAISAGVYILGNVLRFVEEHHIFPPFFFTLLILFSPTLVYVGSLPNSYFLFPL